MAGRKAVAGVRSGQFNIGDDPSIEPLVVNGDVAADYRVFNTGPVFSVDVDGTPLGPVRKHCSIDVLVPGSKTLMIDTGNTKGAFDLLSRDSPIRSGRFVAKGKTASGTTTPAEAMLIVPGVTSLYRFHNTGEPKKFTGPDEVSFNVRQNSNVDLPVAVGCSCDIIVAADKGAVIAKRMVTDVNRIAGVYDRLEDGLSARSGRFSFIEAATPVYKKIIFYEAIDARKYRYRLTNTGGDGDGDITVCRGNAPASDIRILKPGQSIDLMISITDANKVIAVKGTAGTSFSGIYDMIDVVAS